MATPPPSQHPTRINAPLNFRHTDTLITTKVPHYPTKLTTGMSIIPGWNRPNANGQNANINDKDYNGPDFKPRPLKHWRRQLRVYDYKGGANNSRAAAISQLDRPGLTVYHFKPDCACVPGEGGNSYIISNNKFGYETKDDNYSKAGSDVQIQNNGFTVVPYNATESQINDPTNQAYKVLTGVYNTNCINCSPQGNIIKSGIAFQSQAFYSYSNDKLEKRCQTYEQNISMNKAPGCVYFDAQGIPLWPNNLPNGPQVVAPVNYDPTRLFNKPCLSETIYKPNNIGFGRQGAVSGSTRLKKLVSDTVTMNGSSFYSAKGAQEANLGKYQGTNIAGNYYVKIKEVTNSCMGTVPGKPILTVIDIDTNSITFSWEDTGSTLCKVSYYSLTYYAIQILGTIRDLTYDNNYDNYDNNEQFISSSKDIPRVNTVPVFDDQIYSDLNNNIKYKIISKINTNTVMPDSIDTQLTYKLTGLTAKTAYIAYINGFNGNGLGESSDKVISETLLDPNLAINIQPPYSYEYNDLPKVLSGSATSDTQTINSNNIIKTAVAYDINAIYKNVASISSNNNIRNTFKILLQNAGFFKVYALQSRFGVYASSSLLSVPIVISKSTPTISFVYNITKPLIYGRTYQLPNALIGNTNVKKNDGKNIVLNYKPHNNSIASILTDNNNNNPSMYITGVAPFYIIISTILNQSLSQNYNPATPVNSDTFTVDKSTPTITQSTNLITSGIYGSPYTFYTPNINYYPVVQPSGSIPQTLIYEIINSSPAGIASIDASGKVTITGAGTFNINAYCNSTSIYKAASLSSPLPNITIDKQKPIINFPNTFVTSATYDVSYNLVPANINNTVQTLSYNVINSAPANNVVNISTVYNNTNTIGGSNSGTIQYLLQQSNNIQTISYGIINPTYEGFLNSISFQQLNANIPKSYYIVSVQSNTHKVNINSIYTTYSNADGMSSNITYPNPNYPAFPNFSQAILSTTVDDIYISNISIALSYPPNIHYTNIFACDLVVSDTITGNPVNLTNNPLSSFSMPANSLNGGGMFMYNFPCSVILTETQLANATLVINIGSNSSFYPSNNGNMYIEINYISILTSKCSIVSIPANVTTPQNFDLTDFAILMHPAHSYTISLWLLGNITQNVSGYEIYSGNGTVCATNGSTSYIYGTIKQGVPITTLANIATPLYFNSVGKFNINASCISTSNYKANNQQSNKIVIAKEVPVITFSQNLNTTCVYNIGFVLPIPIATVNNNIQNIYYSLVNADDNESKSTVATINPEGTQLLINSVGTFRIKASVIETTSLDFSKKCEHSNVITITKATLSITFGSTFQTTVTYLKNYTYQITGVTTTNTDTPGPILSYSSSDTSVATISSNTVTMISTVNIISSGNFYIKVSCPPTTNFNGVTSIQSPTPINIIKAKPVFTIPPDFAKIWTFTSYTPYSLTGIKSSNTDSNSSIQYTIFGQSRKEKNVAQLITPSSPLTQVTQIKINNAGSFTLQVQSPETRNFIAWGVDPPIYIIIPQITPIISFLTKLPNSWVYGNNPYTFTAATIANNDPSQIVTYSITTIDCPNPSIGFFADNTKPSITVNSVGTFKVNATCLPSTNGNYTAPSQLCISRTISVGAEVPVITFSSSLINSITYAYNLNYTLPQPIATVNNSVQTQSLFSYSAVNMDSDILSPVASISSNNASIIVNSVGNFRIYAQVGNSINHDFGANEAYYSINITKATPTITSFSALSPPPTAWVYDSSYNIPYPTTSNTDATSSAQIVSYSTDFPNIISISGTVITIIGVGKFNIKVTIGATTNYNSPPPFIYSYTSIKATPVITFPKKFVKQLIYGSNYPFFQATATNIDPLTQPISYNVYPTNSSVATIKYIKGSPYVTINSVGKFQIQASCPMSTNGHYNGVPLSSKVLSDIIKITTDIPTVTFNTANFNRQYTYSTLSQPTSPPPLPTSSPIASINPSNTTQILRYSIVTDDSTLDTITPSNSIATITSDGTSINTIKTGMFKIYAQADETPSLDYGECSSLSNIINITQATPTITSTLVIPTSWVYNSSYNIPYPTTSNTDTTPAPVISYSTDYPDIISISGTVITIIGVGNFNIKVTVGATTNYNSPPPFVYPLTSPYYYTSKKATPVITFPQTLVKSAKYGSPYTFTPAIITNKDPSQTITYSIISISPANTVVASFANNANPASIIINSYGTFQIQASCIASSNGYYNGATNLLPLSPAYIQVSSEVPKILFNVANFNSSYLYAYSNAVIPTPYTFTSLSPIASITPNNGNQILTYSAVEVDSDTPSPFATISSIGTGASQIISITTNSVGSFRICAQTASIGLDYGKGHEFSNTININKATPTITLFSALSPPPSWIYSSITPQTYSIAYPTTSNTDPNLVISYSILTPTNTTIATVSGTNITSTGVGQFQISVTIAATTNYTQATFIYPSPSTYYTFIATPVITFPRTLVKSAKYGSLYTFKPAIITNKDPSQTITYSIISISPANTVVASFANNTIPSITILSAGTFQIQASCIASSNGYYTGTTQLFPLSPAYIQVNNELPNIVFNYASLNSQYTYSKLPQPTSPPPLPSSSSIASITPNNGNQILKYSTVVINNDDIISNVATISSDGISLTTNTVGTFRILVETASIGLDYGEGNGHSNIITIIQATPIITSSLTIPSSWVYDSSYNIPYPTTSNTDTTPAPVISYSTDYPDIISISGTVITIIGVGNFNIKVTVGATTNYNSPPPFVYSYTSIQATTDIEFPKAFHVTATYDTPYIFMPAQFVVGDPSSQTITYSIQ